MSMTIIEPEPRPWRRSRTRPTTRGTLFVVGDDGIITITALPAPVNLHLYQGDDFFLRIVVRDDDGRAVNLEGAQASVQSQIRVATNAPIAGEFETSLERNVITLHLTTAISTLLPFTGVWDVEVTVQGRVTTLAAGIIQLDAEVTR